MKLILETLDSTLKELRETLTRKNQDYSGAHAEFHNFITSAELVGITVGQGILVRLSDKVSRVGNLIQKGAAVKDESIMDTLNDLVGYAIILKAWLSREEPPGTVEKVLMNDHYTRFVQDGSVKCEHCYTVFGDFTKYEFHKCPGIFK